MKTLFLTFLIFSVSSAQFTPVKSGVYRWSDHEIKTGANGELRKIIRGTSPHMEYLEMHAMTVFAGTKPAEPRRNYEIEECIIVKEGTMKATLEGKSRLLGPGSVILFMPTHTLTIENAGDDNLTYFVMRYRSKKRMDIDRGQLSGGSIMINADSLIYKANEDGSKGGRAYFDRSTSMCERFEMHITQLNKKGPSHEPHAHIESEIILVLSGRTEMTIEDEEYRADAGDFYFMGSQLQHGVRNAVDEPCSYFAFKWN